MMNVINLHGGGSRSKYDGQNIAQNDGTLRCPIPSRFRVRTHPIDDLNGSDILNSRSGAQMKFELNHSNVVSFVIHISVGGLLGLSIRARDGSNKCKYYNKERSEGEHDYRSQRLTD